MSYQIGIDTVCLKATGRPAHTEYCSNDALVRAVTGRDPQEDAEAMSLFYDAWQFDILWITDDGPVPWESRGRVTDMGHGEFLEGGRDKRAARPGPFTHPEQVWQFDAAAEYGLPDLPDLVAYYEDRHRANQAAHPHQVCTGGYYKTLISGAIAAFGWEMLLLAAADRHRFERVLDGFARLSARHFEAWCRTAAPVLICHDDICWSEGPFMDPGFYRDVVIPRYADMWKPARKAGKKVLYCSDGDFTMFLDQLSDAGADGFIFEPLVALEDVVQGFGRTHVIIGSKVDCRTLTFGTRQEIRAQIDATLELAGECPGFVFAVGNHIPSNVPIKNARFYFEYLSRHWSGGAQRSG